MWRRVVIACFVLWTSESPESPESPGSPGPTYPARVHCCAQHHTLRTPRQPCQSPHIERRLSDDTIQRPACFVFFLPINTSLLSSFSPLLIFLFFVNQPAEIQQTTSSNNNSSKYPLSSTSHSFHSLVLPLSPHIFDTGWTTTDKDFNVQEGRRRTRTRAEDGR